MRLLKAFAAFMCLGCLAGAGTMAETAEIRLARQFSMGYLQFNVMEHEQLWRNMVPRPRPRRM